MKKDIFNGNIKTEYIGYVKVSLIFFVIACLFPCCVFFFVALLYEKVEYAARILMFVMSGVLLVASFLYPLISLWAIKNYDKHPKLAKKLIKEFVFIDFDEKLFQYLIEKGVKEKNKK